MSPTSPPGHAEFGLKIDRRSRNAMNKSPCSFEVGCDSRVLDISLAVANVARDGLEANSASFWGAAELVQITLSVLI